MIPLNHLHLTIQSSNAMTSKENSFIDNLVRWGLLFLLIGLSFLIVAPFVIMIIWGIIIAVAIFPFFVKSVKFFGNKKALTAFVFTLVLLSIIIIPSILLTGSTAHGYQNLRTAYQEGKLIIPEPTEEVNDWPLIGEKLYAAWDLAAHNLRQFFQKYAEQVQGFAGWFVETMTSLGLTVVQFIVSIIIAGVLLNHAEMGKATTNRFAVRVLGESADDFVKLTAGTIRSVVQGILGIAFIQSLATAILTLAFGIPIPGLWALIVLIIAIVQLPPLLVLGPMIVYVFSVHDTVPATIFTVFAVLISISDSLLKPVFLGRGVDIPMLVVLIGAIGGMLVFGILGLFVGAVVLALSYKLLMAWLKREE